MNSVFFGGKQIGVDCLRHLLDMGVRPALVVANPDDTGTDFPWHESLVKVAQEAGLETLVGRKLKEPKVIERVRSLKPDVIFCIGSMQIIPQEILDIPPKGVWNLHPALLPKYRGRYSTVHAIFNGETETGVTLHLMDAEIDHGPIIAQTAFPITPDDTGKTVYEKFTKEGANLFRIYAERWAKDGVIPTTPQDESKATYYPKGLPNDGEINWNWSGKQIRDFIRAMTFEPFPNASFRLGDKEDDRH